MDIGHGYSRIDFENWKRKDTFILFGSGEYPFVGLTTMVDVSGLAHACKEAKRSFFNAFVFVIMTCANRINNFRYRIYEDEVILCDQVDPLFNIMDNDADTFSFAIAPLRDNFHDFDCEMEQAKARALEQPGLSHNRLDTISVSCLPWFTVTDMIQPLGLSANGTIPRCVWGKMEENGLRTSVPFSLTAHHGLLDGKHISQLLTAMATMMEDASFVEEG